MVALRHRTRQLLAVTAGACVGLTGVLMSAAPASAGNSDIRDFNVTVHSEFDCDLTTGESVIKWVVENSENGLEAEITDVRLSVDGEDASADQLSIIKEGADLPTKGNPLIEEMQVNADTKEVKLTVSAHWDVDRPGRDATGTDTVRTGGMCGELAFTSACDTLTVSVTNPAGEADAAHVEAVVTVGGETEELTVAPGETGDATFDAEEGTVATVALGDEETELAWEQPEDCDEEGGEGGGGEDLPETGVPTGLLAGGAVLLIALGGVLYALARRRRSSFTA